MPPHTTPTPRPTSAWGGTRPPITTKTRRRILARDKVCQIAHPHLCVDTPREIDHVMGVADALAAGWTPDQIDDDRNLQAVCTPCHQLKTNAEQARGRARARTTRPKQRPAPPHPGLRQP